MSFDLTIRGGVVFDGQGNPGQRLDAGIRDGTVVALEASLPAGRDNIDATGCWVTPGFIDNHTHYDAELLLAPGLPESVRHGVTTVCIGSCSLSTIFSDPEDCADLFSRVEAVPRPFVLKGLQGKTWTDAAGYRRHLESLPLGPNLMSFVGHSDLRTAVMGLDRATRSDIQPTPDELAAMKQAIEASLDAGFLGLSCMTNPWDKVGGDRARSRPLPSTFAYWSELRALHSVLREHDAILQSAPNITTKVNAALYLMESASFGLRKPLRTTLITVADTKADPWLSSFVLGATKLWERVFASNFRWQSVPMPFEVYADGIDLVVFEEFGAGEEALHLVDQLERNALFADPEYRRRFRKDYDKQYGARVWQRDFHDAEIVSAPEPGLAGRTIGAVADERGEHPVDTFLDLVSAHGTDLRWRTTIANHRPPKVREIIAHPNVHPGFADSGAHLRNMAFYNFGLHVLRMAVDSEAQGIDFLDIPTAIHRVTGEIASWYGVDSGRLALGATADIAVVDPQHLDASLDAYHEAPIEVFGGLSRMVRRNDDAVRATVIGGQVAWRDGQVSPELGHATMGRFLSPRDAAPVPLAMASK